MNNIIWKQWWKRKYNENRQWMNEWAKDRERRNLGR